MDKTRLKNALDTDIGVPLKPVRRIEVLARMTGRHRVWTLEQKLALVLEMERCDNVAAFAREREVSMALLYTWRRELRYAIEAAKLPPRDKPMLCRSWVGRRSRASASVPTTFRVLVTRRPRYGCRSCEDAIIEAPAPGRIVEGGIPTEAPIAQVLVAKYADHLPRPVRRRSTPRQGIDLDRSTLADWVGRAAWYLRP